MSRMPGDACGGDRSCLVPCVVVGGGLVGCAAALALARILQKVVLIDAADWTKGRRDRRALTVTAGSQRILSAFGGWPVPDEARQAQDIQAIEIFETDGRNPDHPQGHLMLTEADHDQTRFGSVVFADVMLGHLREQIRNTPNIEVVSPRRLDACVFESGSVVLSLEGEDRAWRASLLVVSDGARSPLRHAWQIPTDEHHYGVDALVAVVHHTRSHQGIACEHFRPSGPFAVLPMAGQSCGIVWTDRPRDLAAWCLCPPERLIEGIAQRMIPIRDRLGALTLDTQTPPRCYPLVRRIAHTMSHQRAVLIGDAAHTIHPIAGLGYNLSLRDVEALACTVEQAVRYGADIGSPESLSNWAWRRRPDVMALSHATHGLNAVFGLNAVPLRRLRRLGIGLFRHGSGLRRLVAAGAMYGSASVPRGSSPREKAIG